jgi:D-alanine-D-alanine ligase
MVGAQGKEGFPFHRVVLVADELPGEAPLAQTRLRRDLEKTQSHVLSEIKEAIANLGLEISHYQDPAQLAANASQHFVDIVLSIYGGQESRNRMALIPAICETFGLQYLGADAYGRIVSQDKETSKRLAMEVGLLTPDYLVIREPDDLMALKSFPTPFVVKPLWEGSSIGIGPNNLIKSTADGLLLANELLEALRQPLIVEAFVPGKEVNYSLIQLADRTEARLTEAFLPGSPNHFDSHLYDAEEKLDRNSRLQNRPLVLDLLSEVDREGLARLPKILGGLGYARIDGKLFNNRFQFIEITPDAWLASSGSFASGFLSSGWSYKDVIGAVLLSRREQRPHRQANG